MPGAPHPQLELVDWDAYAAGHPEWFQTDAVHLRDAGGVAMAHLIHRSVIGLTSPLRAVPAALPPLRTGRAYNARLRATGGTGPYRWRVVAGRPVPGLHLLADGRIYGRPRVAKPLDMSVQVTDSEGLAAVRRVVVRRALDVGEQEGDGARGKPPHAITSPVSRRTSPQSIG